MYVEAKHDRVTVVFSTIFKDEDDIVLGKGITFAIHIPLECTIFRFKLPSQFVNNSIQ